MTLPAIADERQRTQHGVRNAPAPIDQNLLPAGRSAANPPAAVAAVDRWDRQTDGRTDGRQTVTQTLLRIQLGRGASCSKASGMIAGLGDDAAELLAVYVRRAVVAAAEVDNIARTDQVQVVAELSARLHAVHAQRQLRTAQTTM